MNPGTPIKVGGARAVILDSPTAEETAKVRQYECRTNGHSYVDITAWGVDGPMPIKCSNCGKSWSVVQDSTLDSGRGK